MSIISQDDDGSIISRLIIQSQSSPNWITANNFSWWLRLGMERKGFTEEEFAEKSGLSVSSIKRYRNPKYDNCASKIRKKNLEKILEALGEDLQLQTLSNCEFMKDFLLTDEEIEENYLAELRFDVETLLNENITSLTKQEAYFLYHNIDVLMNICAGEWKALCLMNELSGKSKACLSEKLREFNKNQQSAISKDQHFKFELYSKMLSGVSENIPADFECDMLSNKVCTYMEIEQKLVLLENFLERSSLLKSMDNLDFLYLMAYTINPKMIRNITEFELITQGK